jgi:tripartite-type tricarboxylate transporter receptor subunit TctC
VTSWNGVAAPAGVPAPIIALLSAEIRRALASSDVQDRMVRLGLDARGSTPQEMHDQMARDIAKWRAVIDKAGIPKH